MRDVEPMTDAALDREITDALAIDPSPEFTARVRQRVSRERRSPALRWEAFGAVAAVAVIALYLVGVSPTRRASSPLVARSISAVVTTPRIAPGIVLATDDAPRSSVPSTIDTTVLVDEREARATRELISGVVSGRVDLASLLNTTASAQAFLDVVPIRESDPPASSWSPPVGTIETGVPQ